MELQDKSIELKEIDDIHQEKEDKDKEEIDNSDDEMVIYNSKLSTV